MPEAIKASPAPCQRSALIRPGSDRPRRHLNFSARGPIGAASVALSLASEPLGRAGVSIRFVRGLLGGVSM
jgi:hypothetical protein